MARLKASVGRTFRPILVDLRRPTSRGRFRFLDLPGQLRNLISDYILADEGHFHIVMLRSSFNDLLGSMGEPRIQSVCRDVPVSALVLVNRQVSAEFRSRFKLHSKSRHVRHARFAIEYKHGEYSPAGVIAPVSCVFENLRTCTIEMRASEPRQSRYDLLLTSYEAFRCLWIMPSLEEVEYRMPWPWSATQNRLACRNVLVEQRKFVRDPEKDCVVSPMRFWTFAARRNKHMHQSRAALRWPKNLRKITVKFDGDAMVFTNELRQQANGTTS